MFDSIITYLGILYGLLLISITFIRNRYTEPFRIDALLIPHPTEATRILNLVLGLAVVGYNIWCMLQ